MGTRPEFVKLILCFWHALLVPPMMQLVHSLHASSLYSTCVLLACVTRAVDDAACAISKRLGPCSTRALLDPGFLAGTNFPADATTCAVFERLGPLLDPGSLAGANYPADATACAVSECLGPVLDPGSLASTIPADATACAVSECLGPVLDPGSLASMIPADATACVVMTRPTMLQVQQSCDS